MLIFFCLFSLSQTWLFGQACRIRLPVSVLWCCCHFLKYEYTTSKMQCVSLSLVPAVLSLVVVEHDDALFALLCFAQAKNYLLVQLSRQMHSPKHTYVMYL